MSALIGQLISYAEMPETVTSTDETDISNISSTSFIAGSPEVSVTFVAPSSGKVLVINSAGLRNNSGADQLFVDSEIRVTNSAGVQLRAPNVAGDGTLSCADESINYEYKSRGYVYTGLTGGSVYFARLLYRASASNTGDITSRAIIVQPIP